MYAFFWQSSSLTPIAVEHISSLCRRNRIPVNVVDAPQLCTFSLLSTHVDGPLQIGVTTNGRGCKLASRIRREVAASLPPQLGTACMKLGDVRRRIQAEDHLSANNNNNSGNKDDSNNDNSSSSNAWYNETDDSVDQHAAFNQLVTPADADAAKNRRMRWLAQICKYWPLKRLAAITDDDVAAILKSYSTATSPSSPPELATTTTTTGNNPSSDPPTPAWSRKRGKIILAGSGPGHPDLLTRATHKAIQTADLILADKLVPSGVLDLIPRRTPVRIARKFPGNADAAQAELHEQAAAAAAAGQTVLRLKQGDPYLYGRGGEEVEFFRAEGYREMPGAGTRGELVVLPGVTSALSAPLFAGIPATQRDVADQVLVCTGTGKKGKPPQPPGYVPSRTVVFLMALHRVGALVGELTGRIEGEGEDGGRALFPPATPCAVVERASCPDQRVIRTTLGRVAEAVEHEGSRPPGLLVVGRACEALLPKGGEGEKGSDEKKKKGWTVEEGFRGLDFEGEELAAATAAAGGGEGVVAA